MSYQRHDHAAWVEDNNRAANRLYANRKSYRPAPEALTDFQAKVMDILGMVEGGIYNASITWEKVEWGYGFGGLSVVVRDAGYATWDFAKLTRLVFLCHEARIRCDLSARTGGYFGLVFHPRTHDGGMAERHPNLDEAVEAFREYLPPDHRIIYRAPDAQAVAA
jgi:hypothetical protein